MKKAIYSLIITILTLSAAAQQPYSERRDVGNFDKISFALAGEVQITIGTEFRVTLEGNRSYLDDVITEVQNGSLRIRTENRFFSGFNNEKITVYITMPLVNGISVSGSGKVVMEDLLRSDNFRAQISGSGNIYLNEVQLGQVSCHISGSGSMNVAQGGSITSLDLSISGSGDLNVPEVRIAAFSASISGSGRCECTVTNELSAQISGSGRIYYSGNPKVDVRVSSSGRVVSR
jgi:hypothetical protein